MSDDIFSLSFISNHLCYQIFITILIQYTNSLSLIPLHHPPDLALNLLDKLRRFEHLNPTPLAEQPHLNTVAVDIGFEQEAVLAAVDDLRGRELVESRLNRGTGVLEANGPQLAGPHE